MTQKPQDTNDQSRRTHKNEVVLRHILQNNTQKLNPTIPQKVIRHAVEKLTDHRYAVSLINANQEVYQLIRDGVPVEYENTQGRTEKTSVKIIDFNNPQKSRDGALKGENVGR